MATIGTLDQADSLYRRGEYTIAIGLYEQARSIRSDKLYQAFIDENVAQCLRRMGHSSEAIHHARRGIERLARLPVTPTLGELLVTKANCSADMEHHSEALAVLDQAEDVYDQLTDNMSLAQVQVAKARSLAAMGLEKEAYTILEQLLQADLRSEIRSQALNNLAIIKRKENPQAALALLEQDLELQSAINDQYALCVTEINLAGIAIDLGNKPRASTLLAEAQKHARAANATDLVARISMLSEDLRQHD